MCMLTPEERARNYQKQVKAAAQKLGGYTRNLPRFVSRSY